MAKEKLGELYQRITRTYWIDIDEDDLTLFIDLYDSALAAAAWWTLVHDEPTHTDTAPPIPDMEEKWLQRQREWLAKKPKDRTVAEQAFLDYLDMAFEVIAETKKIRGIE